MPCCHGATVCPCAIWSGAVPTLECSALLLDTCRCWGRTGMYSACRHSTVSWRRSVSHGRVGLATPETDQSVTRPRNLNSLTPSFVLAAKQNIYWGSVPCALLLSHSRHCCFSVDIIDRAPRVFLVSVTHRPAPLQRKSGCFLACDGLLQESECPDALGAQLAEALE